MSHCLHSIVFAAASGVLLGSTAAAVGATVPLTSFETPESIKSIAGSACSLASEHATEGKNSLRVDFSNGDYPNIVFAADKLFATQDWGQAGALTFDAFNADSVEMKFTIRCRDASGGSCDTSISLPPGRQQRVAVILHLPNKVKMGGYPVNQTCKADRYGSYGLGFLAKPVVSMEFFLDHPGHAQTAYFDHFCLEDIKTLSKIVDAYGQSALQQDWPGKIHNDRDLIDAHRREAKELAARLTSLQASGERDVYGGWAKGPRQLASGWFRTAKIDGKWWLVTPTGHLFWSTGITDVGQGCSNIPGDGNLGLFAWLPTAPDPLAAWTASWGADFYMMNLYRTFGKDLQAPSLALTRDRMTSWGFNTLGGWSSNCTQLKKPFTLVLGDSNADPINGAADFFGSAWAAEAEAAIRKGVEEGKDNPFCIGYFVGNERNWTGPGALPVDALKEPGTRAAKVAFTRILRDKYHDIARLNQAWAITAPTWSGWTDFEAKPVVLPDKRNAALEQDLSGLLSAYANHYYSTVNALVKKYAPNQLYLGSRFSAVPPDEVAIAAGNHCDVVTYNIYGKCDVLLSRGQQIVKFDKPVMVGEFHFGALDRGMFGGGMVTVKDQQAKAQEYANYVNTALAQPWCVGVHWFQYIDQPIAGRGDGENGNVGLVSVGDVPYPEMVAQAKRVNFSMYQTRSATPVAKPAAATPAN
jgi:hypothetical protein